MVLAALFEQQISLKNFDSPSRFESRMQHHVLFSCKNFDSPGRFEPRMQHSVLFSCTHIRIPALGIGDCRMALAA